MVSSRKWELILVRKKKNPKEFARTFEHVKIYAFQKHFVVCTNCDLDQWLEKSQYEEFEQTRATSKVGGINTLLLFRQAKCYPNT